MHISGRPFWTVGDSLCSAEKLLVFLQRSQDAQPALQTPGVVIHNVILNHLYQLLAVGKTPSVVALSLQDAPEPFHGAVVNAFGYARHALSHSSGCKFGVEGAVGVLESSVGVYQRMCIRIKCNCFLKGLKYQGIVITVTNYKRHNTAVIEVKNCAEINFPDLRSNVIFEFRYISQPLYIRHTGTEIAVEDVFGNVLRVRCLPGAAIVSVLNCGFNVQIAANTQYALVAYRGIVETLQISSGPAVSLVWTFCVNFFYQGYNALIPLSPCTFLAGKPFVIRRSGYMEQTASLLNGVIKFLNILLNCSVFLRLSYLRKASLLSISSSFFSRSRSILVI